MNLIEFLDFANNATTLDTKQTVLEEIERFTPQALEWLRTRVHNQYLHILIMLYCFAATEVVQYEEVEPLFEFIGKIYLKEEN